MIRRTVLLGSLLLLGACGGAGAPTAGPGPLALFPQPPLRPRVTAYDPAGLGRAGGEFIPAYGSQHVEVGHNNAIFSPNWPPGAPNRPFSDCAFCLYQFQLDDYQQPATLDLVWSSPPPANTYFIGIGIPGDNDWAWFNQPPDNELDLDTFAPYIYDETTSLPGAMVVAIVVLGTQQRRLISLQVGPYSPIDRPIDEITLPLGFSISVYAEVPYAREMCLSPGGTLFVGSFDPGGRVWAVKDYDQDNRADEVFELASGYNQPVGVAFQDGDLYFSASHAIYKLVDVEADLANPPVPQLVSDAYAHRDGHEWKFIRFGPDGQLYVPIGAPCNICDANAEDGVLFYGTLTRMQAGGAAYDLVARGIRNTVGFDWSPVTGELWFTDNGRDNLGDNIPNDELNRIPSGSGLNASAPHFGYPYWHNAAIPDPDYGSGHDASEFTLPAQELGPHVASLGMRFYTGSMFPAEYQNDIFIAEHGSWNRTVPIGARITRVRVNAAGTASEGYEVFAAGWQREDGSRWGRPADVLVMPDGALLVSDDTGNAIYRIAYGEQ